LKTAHSIIFDKKAVNSKIDDLSHFIKMFEKKEVTAAN